MHPILTALLESAGLKELPAPELELLQKLLQDNLINQRAMQLMVENFAPEAIRQLHPVERTALLKRITPAVRPKGTATWSIVENYATGALSLRAVCVTCKQDAFIRPPEAWREEIPYDRGGTHRGYTFKDHPVTLADIQRCVANLQWQHCGHVDQCPADVAMLWEEKISALVQK